MASLGHVAVGMAAARFHNPPSPSGLRRASQRPSWSSMAAWSALSMLPDVDVIGFLNGVPYEAPWGHRGATHSFTFAIVVGLVVALVARRLKQPALRTALRGQPHRPFRLRLVCFHGDVVEMIARRWVF